MLPLVVGALDKTNVSTAPALQSKVSIAPEASVNWDTVVARAMPSARLRVPRLFTVSALPEGKAPGPLIRSVPPETVVEPE